MARCRWFHRWRLIDVIESSPQLCLFKAVCKRCGARGAVIG